MSCGLAQELVQVVIQKRREQARNIEEDRKRLVAKLAELWVPLRKVLFEQAARGCTVLEGTPKMKNEYHHIEPFEIEVVNALPDELVQLHKDGCLRVCCTNGSWETLKLSFDITKLVEAADNPRAISEGAPEPAKATTKKVHTEVIHASRSVKPGDWARLLFSNEVGDIFSATVIIPMGLDPVKRVFRVDVPLPDGMDASGLHCLKVRKESSRTKPIELDDSPSAKRMKTDADGVPPMPEGAVVFEETVAAQAGSGSSPEGGDREMDCWKRWTDEDLEKLRTVVPQHETACGYAWPRIIPSFPNRSLSSVKGQWERLKGDDRKSQKRTQASGKAAEAPATAPAARPATAPVAKGILMSELWEMFEKNPSRKKDIQAIVDRADYTEAQKMGTIHRFVRELTTPTKK